jgi:N-acetylglucosamine-6-phosphate deacetylase
MVDLLFINARLVREPAAGISHGWLLVSDGAIAAVGLAGETPPEAFTCIDCDGDFLSPGLVDIHCHGASGRDTMEASPEAFGDILREHALRGTTTAVLTTVASPPGEMHAVLRTAAGILPDDLGARLAGIHLEGPWFSPRRRGAHAPRHLRPPDPGEIAALLDHRAVIRRVTLAPELPGAAEAVRTFTAASISVSAGHSDATETEAKAGFASGITQATHLHNAMSSALRDGSEGRPGLAEAALADPRILCELIADGVHVSPALLREAWKRKGWGSLAIVSDATAGAGLPDGVGFPLGELECRVEGNAAWTGEGNGRCLAGSTAFLFDGIRTMVRHAGVPLEEAVAMATLVPARSLGLDREIGSLEPGMRADLLRFSSDWKIGGVWIGGRQIRFVS